MTVKGTASQATPQGRCLAPLRSGDAAHARGYPRVPTCTQRIPWNNPEIRMKWAQKCQYRCSYSASSCLSHLLMPLWFWVLKFTSQNPAMWSSWRESLKGSRANPLCRLPAFDDEIHWSWTAANKALGFRATLLSVLLVCSRLWREMHRKWTLAFPFYWKA